MFRLHPELLTIMRGAEARKDASEAAVHEAMAEFNEYEQWDFPAKLIESVPRRLVAVKLVKGQQTKY